MPIIDQGSGATLVLIPGIQGRWGDLRPAVHTLSRSFRVITFPLCGERTSHLPFDPARGLDNYVAQTAEALDYAGVNDAAICGISFGGIVALRFAAAYPERTRTRASPRSSLAVRSLTGVVTSRARRAGAARESRRR